MASENTPRRLIQQLIFGGTAVDQEAIEEGLEKLDHETRPATDTVERRTQPSKYVEVFEDMIRVLREPERHLLSDEEWEIIERFQRFSYNTRYCLCRLVLRKANQWHPLSSLTKYKAEVGEEGFENSMADLCQPFDSPKNPMKQELEEQAVQFPVKEEDQGGRQDVIDLTIDSDEEDVKPSFPKTEPISGPSHIPIDDQVRTILEFDSANLRLSYFCQDETTMSLFEILERLSVDDLKDLTKNMRSKPLKPNKPGYIAALLNTACSQSVLNFSQTPKAKSRGESCQRSLQQTSLPFLSVKKTFKGRQKTQEERLREMALKKLGRCVRVNYDFFRLIRRLHIISYRSTEHPPSLLLPGLLTSFKKRTYAAYKHTRDPAIWTTREELLHYELALELEAKIDELLETKPETFGVVPPRKFRTPVTPGAERATRSPVTTRRSNSVAQEMATGVNNIVPEAEAEVTPQIQKARKMKEIFATIYSKWKELVCLKQEQGIIPRTPGLERFQPGYVYTRLVHKCLNAFATLKEYESELEILDELLKQRLWRRGKRARWYERRAVILMHHLSRQTGVEVVPILQKALNGVREALEDEDTGIVWRPSLLRRLRRLEKKLQIPLEERATCEGNLRDPEQVYMHAVRIRHRANSLKLDKLWRPIKDDTSVLPSVGGNVGASRTGSVNDEPVFKKSTGKSIWQGINKEEVNVETVALQYYNAFDFKGFHSETRILTTLFALLFWDIIFADVRGAFETPYQTAPLDLCEDSFYLARKDLIDTRLRELKEGEGKEILERHDELHRPHETWCVGVKWDLCAREDLVEIVECLGGESLAMICQLFCEDYAGRSSGVPDLIVWNVDKRICKFVEVKGPKDTLQENQKLWVDSLLGAQAAVEVCNVIDSTDSKSVERRAKKRKGFTSGTSKRKKSEALSEEEDYEQLDLSDSPTLDMTNAPPRKRRYMPTTSIKVDEDGQHPIPTLPF